MDPVTVRVSASKGWQRTGVRVGRSASVEYVTGQISDNLAPIRDGNGTDYVCGEPDCCEPLARERRSALIAAVGEQMWFIGNARRITPSSPGELLLRINDCDEGLHDNKGELVVRVTP